jgi:nucleotide-binding universal stress UspA family protein
MHLQTILVAVDYSPLSAEALRWGASLAQAYGAHVLLLHVFASAETEADPLQPTLVRPLPLTYRQMAPGIWTRSEEVRGALAARAQADLRDFARKSLASRVTLQVRVAVGEPAEQILRVAREEKADLIVMGTHGRRGWRHAVLGSVAEAVMRQAMCPVLTVRTAGR